MISPDIMQLLAFLNHKREDNDRTAKRKKRASRPRVIRGNSQNRMYNPNTNFPISAGPETGKAAITPRGPDLGFGPGATPPGAPMSPHGAAHMAGGIQQGLAGLGQMPPHLAALLAQGGMPGTQAKKRKRREERQAEKHGGGQRNDRALLQALAAQAGQKAPFGIAGAAGALGSAAGGNPMMSILQLLPFLLGNR